MRTILLLLPLLVACSSGNGAKKGDGQEPDKQAVAKNGGQAPSRQADDQTDVQAEEPVPTFLSRYVGAIVNARVHAQRIKGPVRIEVDREAPAIKLVDDTTDKVLASYPYPAGLEILRLPKKVTVLANRTLEFDGEVWDERHPPLKDSAHVLARKPGEPQHAFLRLYKNGKFDPRLVDYK